MAEEVPTPAKRETPSRRMPTVPWQRVVRQSRGWRHLLVDAARTLMWVVPVTVLIWIWAEREQVVVPKGPNAPGVPIQVYTSDPNRVVELVRPQQGTISLKLSGPQEAVDRLGQAAQKGLRIDLGATLGRGNGQHVNTAFHVQSLPMFQGSGVSVVDADPSELVVNVDDLSDATVEVEVRPGLTTLAAPPVFDPPTVRVRGPSRLLDDLRRDNLLHVYAEIGSGEELRVPGEHTLTNVPLSLPSDRLHLQRATVNVKLTVRAADVPAVLNNVPIFVEGPVNLLKQYDVIVNNGDPSTGAIHVTGPGLQIRTLPDQKLLPGQQPFHPKAVLEVSPDDVGRDEPRVLQYVLPDGVHVAPEDAAHPYEFRLVHRDTNG